MEKKMKLLIDTDIGDDVDDAIALLAAMARGFEIVGVTTVFRDTHSRARMVKKLMSGFGRGYEAVPVYPGLPTWSGPQEENLQHMCRFSQDLYQQAYDPDSGDAVDFIIDCCKRYGRELAIIALGPFCNLAEAIRRDPQALNMAGRVAIMGGAYFKQYADWNVMCDVPAADVLFRGVSHLECIGADVTHLLYADDFLMDALAASGSDPGALGYLSRMYQAWQSEEPDQRLLLHDVLVVYHILDPELCAMESIRAAVITEGLAKGLTLNIDGYGKASLNSAYRDLSPTPRILAARQVDLERFYRLLHRDISGSMRPDSAD